jgi:hypothetical protein
VIAPQHITVIPARPSGPDAPLREPHLLIAVIRFTCV